MSEVLNNGFTAIGSKCQPFEHEVGIDALNELRASVVQDFFAEMPRVSRSYGGDIAKVGCAKNINERIPGEIDQPPSIFGAAILRTVLFEDPDFDVWQLRIAQNRMQRARHNNAPQRIMSRLKVEVFNGQVVEAIREVQTIRGVGELTVEAIEKQMFEDVEEGHIVMQRKSYERYMTEDDCEKAVRFLGQIARRTAAVG